MSKVILITKAIENNIQWGERDNFETATKVNRNSKNLKDANHFSSEGIDELDKIFADSLSEILTNRDLAQILLYEASEIDENEEQIDEKLIFLCEESMPQYQKYSQANEFIRKYSY